MPLDFAHGPRPQKPERSGVPGRTETLVARARSIRAIAHAIVRVEQLAAVAHQPVVVKRGHRGNPAFGKQADDTGREARQVMNVRDVRPEFVDDATCDRTDRVIAVRVFEAARRSKRVVDPDDAQAVARFGANLVFRPIRILLAGEDQDFVAAMIAQRPCVRVRVDFGAALRRRRESVDDLQNPHHTILNRRGFHPLTADNAPKYWPSGHANASAIARPRAGIPSRSSFWQRVS